MRIQRLIKPFVTLVMVWTFLACGLVPAYGQDTKEEECTGPYQGGKKPSKEDLAKILLAHEAWELSRFFTDNPRGQRANLCEADLGGAHLQQADLRGAHLEKANLFQAHLEQANLREAHLEEAYLVGAHLEEADLVGGSTFWGRT